LDIDEDELQYLVCWAATSLRALNHPPPLPRPLPYWPARKIGFYANRELNKQEVGLIFARSSSELL
jgi:hypothetical protein